MPPENHIITRDMVSRVLGTLYSTVAIDAGNTVAAARTLNVPVPEAVRNSAPAPRA
ncbi:MAG: hypothetical protein M3O22_01440 [Pseudomonadota bacterium]|nr:hypothetical protein [Pseudomonadota bacterium]